MIYWQVCMYHLLYLQCVPKFTAKLYCICLSITQIYTEADAVQICSTDNSFPTCDAYSYKHVIKTLQWLCWGIYISLLRYALK